MSVKIKFVKDCGHRKEGTVDEFEYASAQQYIVSGFAVSYVEPIPEPEPAPKKAPVKKAVKAKAKKE